MGFNRDLLPSPIDYFESRGLALTKHTKWRTTSCEFHGGRDSMRIHAASGAWRCMNCGFNGGDVLAYEMKLSGDDFVTCAKRLKAWDGVGNQTKPTPFPPRLALEVLNIDVNFVAIVAGNLHKGVQLTEKDRDRLFDAAGRINRISREFI